MCVCARSNGRTGCPRRWVRSRRAADAAIVARSKALEHSLRESESETHELHTILDTATDGVAILDAAGHVLSLNRSAEALFGVDSTDIAGKPFDALVLEESRPNLLTYLAGLREGGVASLLNDGREILFRGPRGGVIPVFITVGRLGTGEAAKFCAVLRDITAWKDAERSLNAAARAGRESQCAESRSSWRESATRCARPSMRSSALPK